MKLPMLAGAAAPFAHLLGRPAANAARAEDNKPEDDDDDPRARRADESDEDYAKRMEEEDKKDEEAKRKAEEDEEKKKEDARRKAEDADDDGDEMKGSSAAAAARGRERARCRAIFSSAAAGKRPDVAAHLAFGTDLPRSAAIALLESVASGEAPRRSALAQRMAGVDLPNPGGGGPEAPSANDPRAIAGRILAAADKASGKVA